MRHLKITIAIVTAHVLTGTASVATRYLVAYLEPVEIAFLRYLFGSALVFGLFFLLRPARAQSSSLLVSIPLGCLFFGLFPFLFSTAFYYTTAARGALVIATMPVWAMLIAHLFRHESIGSRLIAATSVTIAGLSIALWDDLIEPAATSSLTGELVMLAVALTGAIYSVLARARLRHAAPLSYTPVMMLAGCLSLSPWAAGPGLATGVMQLEPGQLLALVYLGCIAGGIAFFLFNWVLHHSSATYTTLFVPLNPLTAIFLGWLLLGESLSLRFLLGSAIVFTGLLIGQATLSKRPAPGGQHTDQ